LSTPTANLSFALRLTGNKTVAEDFTSQPASAGVALLTRCLAAGEEEAFREFHARYFDRLYQFLLVVARGQEHEAQEALQQTLLRVLRYVRVFESEETFWSWLKMLARSAARDAGRKQHRYAVLLQQFAHHGRAATAPQPSVDDNRLVSLLDESLNELEPTDRHLIEGKYLEAASVKELSANTGLTEKAVESRLLRLRRQLRERMINKLRSP
jgi:RNA polymerase sigma-70 factor (ECF subfamily)